MATTEGEVFEYCFTLTVPDIPENPITLVILEVVSTTPGMYNSALFSRYLIFTVFTIVVGNLKNCALEFHVQLRQS